MKLKVDNGKPPEPEISIRLRENPIGGVEVVARRSDEWEQVLGELALNADQQLFFNPVMISPRARDDIQTDDEGYFNGYA